MLTDILLAVAALGVLGLAFGGVLALAERVFKVESDPRADALFEALPGANCGACGFAGCAAFADALLADSSRLGSCPVGGDETNEQCAKILGLQVVKNTRLCAFVKCSGGDHTEKKYIYAGLEDCHAAIGLDGGPTRCPDGCIGLGSCVKSCPFGAISMRGGVAFVDHVKCTGCLKCIKTCPKHIIEAMPYHKDVDVMCSSHLRGAELRAACNIGCLACHMCEKACEYDAIHVVDNLAVIDFNKCIGCGECALKCPRHLIFDAQLDRSEE